MKKVMVYSILLACMMSILLASSSLAKDISVTVNTLPDTYVTIRILPAGEEFSSIQSFYNIPTGSEGRATATYSTELDKVDVELYLKLVPEQTEAEMYERYNGLETGQSHSLSLPKEEDAEIASSESAPESTNTEETTSTEETPQLTKELSAESSDSSTPVTGQAISNSETTKIKPYLFYIVGAIVIVGIVLLGFSFSRRNGPPREPMKHDKKGYFGGSETDIKEAEYKFAEAQSQLERVKKIKETESRMAQDAEELRRLKGE